MRSILVVSLLLTLFSQAVLASKIDIYIRDDVYQDYQKFVGDKDVHQITSFVGKSIRRDVVDMIIAQQALKLGGFDYEFRYIPGKVNFRNTQMLNNGELLISFDSYWLSDAKAIQDNVFISSPVIQLGEYIAGIYTSPENKKALSLKSFSQLSQFTAVSTPKWRTDWSTLSNLPLKELIREDEWLSMARMVSMGWVDYILMPFNSTTDRSFIMERIHLIPVEGVGIQFNDSRHFVISKTHSLGEEAISAINIGLEIMRKNSAINNAYNQAGFFVSESEINILNKN